MGMKRCGVTSPKLLLFMLLLCFSSLCCAGPQSTQTGQLSLLKTSESQAEEIRGIYVVVRPSDKLDLEKVFALDYVSGVSYVIAWKRIQPEQNSLQFDEIDRAVSAAAKFKKKINLVVLAGKYSPEWIYSKGSKKATFTRSLNEAQVESERSPVVETPLPWDNDFVKVWTETVKELAARYDNAESVGYVMITGANLAAFTVGMAVRGAREEDVLRRLRENGYTESKWVGAWQNTIDLFFANFKKKPLCLGLAPLFDNAEPVIKIADYGVSKYGNRLYLLGDYLNGKWFANLKKGNQVQRITDYISASQGRTRTGFQMLWWSAFNNGAVNGPLDKALDNGLRLGVSWLEVWNQDVIDSGEPVTENAKVLRAANKKLVSR